MSEDSDSQALPSTRTLIVATAGHVDHGKTSLVRRLTGTNTDTLAEEKKRGLTINLGYAYSHFNKNSRGQDIACTLGFVDVPGHIDFIGNMLAGVGGIDFALLVVAADDGVMPQTREHLAILDLLGISRAVVALTKIDKVPEQQLELVSDSVSQLLLETNLANAPIFPVSNESGAGIEPLQEALRQETSRRSKEAELLKSQHFRYLIDRSFIVKGIGTVVTGTVRSGSVETGARLIHSGTGESARLRGIRADNTELEQMLEGQRAACNLDIPEHNIRRGDWLLDERLYLPVQRFDAILTLLEPDTELQNSAQYHLYLGASHHIVTVRLLGDSPRPFFQIASHDRMFACYGDRFILRDPASTRTLGGGMVVDIFVPRRSRSSAPRLAWLDALHREPKESLQALLCLADNGVDLDKFHLNRNLTGEATKKLLEELKKDGIDFVNLDIKGHTLPLVLHQKLFAQLKQAILQKIELFQQKHSDQQGISEPALSKTTGFTGSHLVFHAILERLIETDCIHRTGTQLHLPNHRSRLSEEEQAFLDKVRPLLIEANKIAPRTRELVELTGIPLKPLERILKQTTQSGSLIQVAANRHYLPETIMELAEFTEQLAAQAPEGEGLSVIEFRDKSGIGRNLCIEILEYFDRIGFTRRDGNSRFLRTDKANIFGE